MAMGAGMGARGMSLMDHAGRWRVTGGCRVAWAGLTTWSPSAPGAAARGRGSAAPATLRCPASQSTGSHMGPLYCTVRTQDPT